MDERATNDRAFEAEIEAAFAVAPPAPDADVFAEAVMVRLAGEARRRVVLLTAAGVAGGAVLLQSLAVSRGFGGLMAQWGASLSDLTLAALPMDPYVWMAAGLTLAAAALIRGVEA
jgi:hypothetical protein